MLISQDRSGAYGARRACDTRWISSRLTSQPPHDVAILARAVALSSSRLAHMFRTEVGDSVANTILTLRLRQAARLIEHTPRSIGEIAGDVGFNSPFYLSRQFRRRYGVSPRAYRTARADVGER